MGRIAHATAGRGVEDVMRELERRATKSWRDGLARYAIPADRALGVPMREVQALAKRVGRDHALAEQLWKTGCYEARLLAAYVDDPTMVTSAQMDRWCRDFDNWAVCDTVCFALFDRTPYAWTKVTRWAGRKDEYVRRAAFALLWGLTVHDKQSGDGPFLAALGLIETAATDDRPYVKKAVNMALRATGKRTSTLHAAAVECARRLSASEDTTARWVGKDAVRELQSPSVLRRVSGRVARAQGRTPTARR
jgi:3-methyladenine DNA glycosylase AlkD